MHHESTGVHQLFQDKEKVAITAKNPNTGEVYLAVFNISDNASPANISVNLEDLGITKQCTATDMWSGKAEGSFTGTFNKSLKGHACGLYKITTK